MRNFNAPYFATSIRDFWARWHISLSTWLRDYLYIPLGGNRGGVIRTCRNLMITMLLGGLWHGANYTFLLWGCYHGLLLAGHRLLSRTRGRTVPAPISAVVTFALVLIGWMIFRVESLGDLADCFTDGHRLAPRPLLMVLCAAAFVEQAWTRFDVKRFALSPQRPALTYWPAGIGIGAALYYFLKPATDQVFIYFQF